MVTGSKYPVQERKQWLLDKLTGHWTTESNHTHGSDGWTTTDFEITMNHIVRVQKSLEGKVVKHPYEYSIDSNGQIRLVGY